MNRACLRHFIAYRSFATSIISRAAARTPRTVIDDALRTLLTDREASHRSLPKPVGGPINVNLIRTAESNPIHHTQRDLGRFYTVPPDDVARLFRANVFGDFFYQQAKTFREVALLVRPPALELIDYLKRADYSKPVPAFVVYGETGSGKSCTMGHVLHYCGTQPNWLIFACHNLSIVSQHEYRRSILDSLYRPPKPDAEEKRADGYRVVHDGRFDMPPIAVDLLTDFRAVNDVLLKRLNPKTLKKAQWTETESSPAGTPWLDLLDLGISRNKFACDVLGILLREIRAQSAPLGIRTLVMLQGVNALWATDTIFDNKSRILFQKNNSIIHNLRKLLKKDWVGGAIVSSVIEGYSALSRRESYTPLYLLGEEGFGWMEPFVPVAVPQRYSSNEFYTVLDYYRERLWITNPKAGEASGRRELEFLSDRHPLELRRILRTW